MKFSTQSAAGLLLLASAQDALAEASTVNRSLDVLGIKNEVQQDAFLDILRLSGNLENDKIWISVYKTFKFDDDINFQNSKKIEIFNSIKKCLSLKNNHEILNCKIDNCTNTDIMKVFVWLSQNAFNRAVGQERYEITAKYESKEVLEKFFYAAKNFGIIDEIIPSESEYDYAVIPGASTEGMLFRIATFKHYENLGKIKVKNTVVLAGNREAWIEIDRVKDGFLSIVDSIAKSQTDIEKLIEFRKNTDEKSYSNDFLTDLAEQNGIKLKEQKLIKYNTKEDCPSGKISGRTYLNYEEAESRKVTETTIAEYLSERYLDKHSEIGASECSTKIIDTQSEKLGIRPTTESTARNFGLKVAEYLKIHYESKLPTELNFAVVSNQPYAIRQSISLNLEINKAFKEAGLDEQIKINVYPISYKMPYELNSPYFSKKAIESEFAATVADYVETSQYDGNLGFDFELKDLLFQTRDNAYSEYYPIDLMGD